MIQINASEFVNTFIKRCHAGRLFLNATSGTHIYFDKETNVGLLLQVGNMGLYTKLTKTL